MKIVFLGAAREVTGSCFLIDTGHVRFLVDCGMVQGGRDAVTRNSKPFAFDPKSIDFVLLTHAHIDHSGLLPKLTAEGYRGPIYATAATADLLEVMLPDSAHIQESEALLRAKRHDKPARNDDVALRPLYTVHHAYECLRQVRSVAYDQALQPHADVRCCYRDAGHILGSAILEIWVSEPGQTTKLVFSGDLGQPARPILRDPTIIEETDILVIESTYGNRNHKCIADTEEELLGILKCTLPRGNVIIPAFAVGRTQEILYELSRLTREGLVKDLKIFVDSPMATEATRITRQHMELFDAEAKEQVVWQSKGSGLPYIHFTESVEESKALNKIRSGAIIISASGMCDAGRIKHHLRQNLPRPECSVLITGFQAQGTLGRRLVDGEKKVRIFGENVLVRASVHTVGCLSAHADRQALLDWAGHFSRPPKHTFVVHGEESTALEFADTLRAQYGWDVTVPEVGAVAHWEGLKEVPGNDAMVEKPA